MLSNDISNLLRDKDKIYYIIPNKDNHDISHCNHDHVKIICDQFHEFNDFSGLFCFVNQNFNTILETKTEEGSTKMLSSIKRQITSHSLQK